MPPSDPSTPRPKAKRVQPPPVRVTASTPESIVRLLSDLTLNPGPPPAAPSSSLSSKASRRSAGVRSTASSGRTASTLDVDRRPLRDPFGPDDQSTDGGGSLASSGLSASRLNVGGSSPWGSSAIHESDLLSESGSSVAWSEDLASSTIESFMTNTVAYMASENPDQSKLQLWQSLCLEFGLCTVPSSDIAFDRPPSRSSDSSSVATVLPTRAAARAGAAAGAAQIGLHPFPLSLNKARKILKQHAHVNLRDYMEHRAKLRKARDASEVAVIREHIRALNWPTAAALKKYTRENRRFYRLSEAKAGWLNPLLVAF